MGRTKGRRPRGAFSLCVTSRCRGPLHLRLARTAVLGRSLQSNSWNEAWPCMDARQMPLGTLRRQKPVDDRKIASRCAGRVFFGATALGCLALGLTPNIVPFAHAA